MSIFSSFRFTWIQSSDSPSQEITGFPATLTAAGSRLRDAKMRTHSAELSVCGFLTRIFLVLFTVKFLYVNAFLCYVQVYGCYLQEGQSNKIFHSHYQKPVLHIS